MLASEVGKTLHSILRPELNKVSQNKSTGTQWGSGLNSGSTESAHLYVKACMDIAQHKSKSLILLCLDVKTAYATLLRNFVLDVRDDDDAKHIYLKRLLRLGLKESEALETYNDAEALHSFINNGGSEHLAELLKDMHSCAWFSTESLNGVIKPMIGALAGTSLGDLVFTLGISRVFRHIRARLLGSQLAYSLDQSNIFEVFGIDSTLLPQFARMIFEVSFVDDGVYPLFEDAHKVEKMIAEALCIIDTEFMANGLMLNFKAGKTEALVFFKGPGAVQARKHLFEDMSGKVSFKNDFGHKKEVLCSDTYKNVGSLVTLSGSLLPEISMRMGALKGALNKIQGKVLRNQNIQIRRKNMVVKSYLLSKGLFHAGTWRRLGVSEAKKVHVAIMKAYRCVLGLGKPTGPRMNDQEVVDTLKVRTPLGLVVGLRIDLFLRVLAKMQGPLLLVLAHASSGRESWIKTVHNDLLTLAKVSGKLQELRDKPIMDWIEVIMQNPCLFKKLVNKLLDSDEVNTVTFWWPKGVEKSKSDVNSPVRFVCDCEGCGYECKSVQALNWHKYDKHDLKHEIRHCVSGVVCECCLQCFHTRERLVRHIIATSVRCKRFYYETAEPADPAVVKREEAEAYRLTKKNKGVGRRSTNASGKPVFVVFGPLTPEAEGLGISHSHRLKCKPKPKPIRTRTRKPKAA